MQYKIEQITDDIDILELTEEEYKKFNSLFYGAFRRHYPNLVIGSNVGELGPVRKIILTDGSLRAEFFIKIENKKEEIENNNNTII